MRKGSRKEEKRKERKKGRRRERRVKEWETREGEARRQRRKKRGLKERREVERKSARQKCSDEKVDKDVTDDVGGLVKIPQIPRTFRHSEVDELTDATYLEILKKWTVFLKRECVSGFGPVIRSGCNGRCGRTVVISDICSSP